MTYRVLEHNELSRSLDHDLDRERERLGLAWEKMQRVEAENIRLELLLRTLVTTLKIWLDSTAEVETPETDQRRAMMMALIEADLELLKHA